MCVSGEQSASLASAEPVCTRLFPSGHTDMVAPCLGTNCQLKICSFFSCCPLMSSSLEKQVPEMKHFFLPPLCKHFRDLETVHRLIKKSFWFCPLDISCLTWVSSRTPSDSTHLSGCPKGFFPWTKSLETVSFLCHSMAPS